MSIEVGIPYEIVGPDGTRAVFNDSTDPDFVGLLDPDAGVSGLDSAEVRESADVVVEGDGGIHGEFFYGRRPVIFQGVVAVDETMAANVARQEKLERATNAMRADAEVSWTPSGSVKRRLLVRRQQPLRITQRRPKAFQASLVSAKAFIESYEEHSSSVLASGVGESGFGFDLDFDVEFGGGVLNGQILANNAGTAQASPRFRIDGPITNPTIRNATTGEDLRFIYTLAAGEWLEVDAGDEAHTVKLGGATDRYSAIDWSNSTWWKLEPGTNDLRLLATAFSAPAALTVYWRDSWA